jgi:hypothetical protein
MSIAPDTIKALFKFENKDCCFIETGTESGATLAVALDIGFSKVKSIEAGEDSYNKCCDRFSDDERVTLYHGSSANRLYEMCKDEDGDLFFWLDGHYSGGDTFLSDNQICPLYEELDQIKKLKNNTHTILIDDIRDVYNGYMQVDMEVLKNKLLQINPEYKLSFLPGYQKDDIMMATTKDISTKSYMKENLK